MPESVLQINKLFKQICSQLIDFKNELFLSSASSQTSEVSYNYIQNVLKSFGLECRKFGEVGMSVDIPGNRNNLPVIAICVNCGEHFNNKSSDFQQSHNISNELHSSVWIIQTVIGLGVAKIFSDLQTEMKGNARIIFQFNQDRDFESADFMIQQGVLEQVAVFYGLNYLSSIHQKCVGLKFGPLIASYDNFTLKLLRKKSEQAYSQNDENLIQIAAQVVISLKHSVARKIDPLKPVVISISSIHSEPDKSIVPHSVTLKGAFQIVDDSNYHQVPAFIEKTVRGITSALAVDFNFTTENKSPILKADNNSTLNLFNAAKEVLRAEYVLNLEYPTKGLEGLKPYLKVVPGSVLHFGTNYTDIKDSHQSSDFNNYMEFTIEACVKSLCLALFRSFHHSSTNS